MSSSSLPKLWNIVFITGRVILWSIFFFGMFTFAFSLFFPSFDFVFDFENSKAERNTLQSPRTDTGDPRGNGRLAESEMLIVDASIFGDFSNAIIGVSGDDSVRALESGSVSIRRSQKAFLYPEGSLAPFPKGSLLRFGGDYFQIAPNGTRKRFPSEDAVRSLGFDPNVFLVASSEELLLHRDGGSVEFSGDEPPSGSFIHSDGIFYEWRNGKLIPFVSRESFLARFPENWALPRDVSFIRARTVSDEWRGYPSGSLLSWGDGVFLMDGESPRPILGVDIFLSLGYSWDDVRPANDEEISLVPKGKFVDVSVPHPDGTVLLDTRENRYFLIEEGKKREIRGETILHAWLGNRHPILVSSESLQTRASCVLEEGFSPLSSYYLECSIPLAALREFHGDTYEFSIDVPADTDIRRLDVSFETSVSKDSLFRMLSKLKERILSRYIPES
jgi:hypothetical protein